MTWYNPKYPRPEQAEQPSPSPPVDTGRRLLTLPRGQGTELRVSLSEYEGKPYVSLRVWTRGEGGYYPSKSGTSIRIREIGDTIEALMQVEDLVREQGRASRERPSGDRPSGGHPATPRQDAPQRSAVASPTHRTPDRTPPQPDRSYVQPGPEDEAPRFIDRRRRPHAHPPFDPTPLREPPDSDFSEFD